MAGDTNTKMKSRKQTNEYQLTPSELLGEASVTRLIALHIRGPMFLEEGLAMYFGGDMAMTQHKKLETRKKRGNTLDYFKQTHNIDLK